jgi:hypothetical protein
MRVLAAATVTTGIAALAMLQPAAVLAAVVICVVSFVLLAWAAWHNPSIASLRHATLAAGTCAVLSVTLGIRANSIMGGTAWLHAVVLSVITFPALYWLILLGTGGFDER